ncbi:hypothetical protein Hanom_Chr05g00463331 [Helianthus anomalus]
MNLTLLLITTVLIAAYAVLKGEITSFVLYLYTTFQAVSFLTSVDRRCPLLGILLQV